MSDEPLPIGARVRLRGPFVKVICTEGHAVTMTKKAMRRYLEDEGDSVIDCRPSQDTQRAVIEAERIIKKG